MSRKEKLKLMFDSELCIVEITFIDGSKEKGGVLVYCDADDNENGKSCIGFVPGAESYDECIDGILVNEDDIRDIKILREM